MPHGPSTSTHDHQGLLLILLALWTYLKTTPGQRLRTRNIWPLSGLVNSTIRCVQQNFPLICMACAAIYASRLSSLPESSLICSTRDRYLVRVLQCIGVTIDLVLAVAYNKLICAGKCNDSFWRHSRLLCIGQIFLVCNQTTFDRTTTDH